MSEVKRLPKATHVDFLVKALAHLAGPGTATPENAFARTSELANEDAGIPTWSMTELAALNEYVEEREDDLDDVAAIVPNRSKAEVVNWFYQEQGSVKSVHRETSET
jgi:hypothetical protein